MKPRHTPKQASTGVRRIPHKPKKDVREEIINWLRDAYAMEKGLEAVLQKQTLNKSISKYVRTAAGAHVKETRRHAEEVKSALKLLDADTSALKTGFGLMTKAAKGLSTLFTADQEVKDLLYAYSMEHFEIAFYTCLAAAAEAAGYAQVAQICRDIIPDEEHTAELLKENLPGEVLRYLFETEPVRV